GTALPFGANDTNPTGSQIGFTYMSSALMAAQHFNERNPAVVPELIDPLYQQCTYQIDLDESVVIDSQLVGQAAGIKVMRRIQKQGGRGCAMVGPYADDNARGISNIAWSVGVPIVLNHALDYELSNKELYPYTTQINAMVLDVLFPLVQFLISLGRDNFISVLYQVDDRTSSQMQEALTRMLRGQDMFTNRQGFIVSDENARGLQGILNEDNSVEAALSQLKQDGNFRTIVVLLDAVELHTTLPLLAQAAEDLNMNKGDYVWVFFGSNILPLVDKDTVLENELIVKLMQGAALVDYLDPFYVDGLRDPFLRSWVTQGNDTVDQLNDMNPLEEGDPGYFFAEDDYFRTFSPSQGSSYVYDAVMSIGMGACTAGAMRNFTNITGFAHNLGIDDTKFLGASGTVEFAESSVFQKSGGTRNVTSAVYGGFNLLPYGAEEPYYVLTDIFDPNGNSITVRSMRENITNCHALHICQ
ncbi:MAG: hypothetical protein SGILL_003875, partial [Bacillariaceae sp.]